MFSTFLVTGKLSASCGRGIMAVTASQNNLETKAKRNVTLKSLLVKIKPEP